MLVNRSLNFKKVAVTGCTGGLGKEICISLLAYGAELIMLDRNEIKAEKLETELKNTFKDAKITRIKIELEDMNSVKAATDKLLELSIDVFIENAGAYSIPRHICTSSYDNIFQINFVSPYYMALKLSEKLKNIKIVAVGSIAHTYGKINENDIDFKNVKSAAKAYGNSKRFLMLALSEMFRENPECLSIAHPGITFTNITAHYPKLIFAIIKHPMKIIFMKPKKAAKCIIEGVFDHTEHGTLIGPRIFNIWGKPKKMRFKAAFTEDSKKAVNIADKIIDKLNI